MPIPNHFVAKALLKHNYFPKQKKDRGELPPCFSSKGFTRTLAKKLTSSLQRKPGVGWDSVSFRSTRFNGVPRMLSIPHPVAHAHLCLFIAEHWQYLEYTASNQRSLIRPRQHKDGRVIIMDYEASSSKLQRQHSLSFGQRFRVHTDISNCFPSLYTHSIPWAVAGFLQAKQNKSNKSAWFNRLDELVRWCKRNETNGVGIGPAASNIVMEAILAKVDEHLESTHKFSFVRYIDDYTAYCRREEDAQKFIRVLTSELDKYKLTLNIKKTRIDPLPEPIVSSWVSQLSLLKPVGGKNGALNVYDVSNYLARAQDLAKAEPDGSVIKYALSTLLRSKLRPNAREFLIGEMLMLAFYYPIVIPQLQKQFKYAKSLPLHLIFTSYEDRLNALLEEHALHHRSDAMCWLLFFLRQLDYTVSSDAAARVLESRDCFSILSLYFAGNPAQQQEAIIFAQSLDTTDWYELDSYWILLYELFVSGKIKDPYGSKEDCFSLFKKAGTHFYHSTTGL